MAPSRRKGSARAAAAAAAQQQWKVGDLVLAKMKGFPPWPAVISKPENWGFSSVRKKLLVYFYGTKQIAFCNYADIEAFTEEKRMSLLIKRQGKGADFVRAVDEIIDAYETLKKPTCDESILGAEDITPNNGNLEITRNSSFRKNPECCSHIADNQKSDAICVTENEDLFSSKEISAASMEGDLHKINSAIDKPAQRVSILDQLRQTPLAASTILTKKRLRDAPPQSFIVQKRLASLGRSRNSSSSDPPKVKESDMLNNDSDSASDNMTTDGMQEESMINMSSEDMPQASDFHDVVIPITAGLPNNGGSKDTASEIAAIKYEANNQNEGDVLDPSCKIEANVNGCLENEVRQNNQLDLPMKMAIFRKKRKPNRKRASKSTECARLDRDTELQVVRSRSLSESPNSCGEINETDHKADGDEHLPLVKRARVRMGKPLVEEKQFNQLPGTDDKSEVTIMINNCDKRSASFSPGNNCHANGASLGVKDSNSSPINDCSLPAGRDLMPWKAKKDQQKGFTLDVEAALPPSKRLHRALEAMSANAAEAMNDCPEVPRTMEMMPNGCMVSPRTCSLYLSMNGNIKDPTRLHDTHSSECNAFNTSASRLCSQNLDEPTEGSSEVKIDDINSRNLRSSHDKHCNEILPDVKNCDVSSMSKIVDAGIHDKVMLPCSIRLMEKQVNLTYSEGMPDYSSSYLGKVNGNEILQPEEKCPHSPGENVSVGQTVEPNIQKPATALNSTGDSDSFSPGGAFVTISGTIGGATTSGTSGATKSSSILPDESTPTHDMEDVAGEVRPKVTSRDWCISPDLIPMKDLIAAAQAKRLSSQSILFSDNFLDNKVEGVKSPSFIHKEDSFKHGSPSNSMLNHTSATDDRLQHPRNGSRSPHGGLQHGSSSKLTDHAEANVARKSFEALLCTLTRTKESIGRATRLAIDCAKYGIAGEVVDILLQSLERESSLHRRIDLFFLVDSITQCSRSQKGGAGDVYPSLVQSVLPRLLSAAAPSGNAAWENRRQCLKVLRLWLERKTLPESTIRQHIRELDSVNEASFTSTFSRRPSRTERAFNDPVREMEGMLVDEYGSNTSFQIPCLLRATVLEDEEASASDEKSFEAVTPEQHAVVAHEKENTERHRHILEDVDGELEMEDAAPLCDVEVSSSHISGADTICNTHNQPDQPNSLPFTPPLPDDRPPSPPPLPSSPPPLPPPCSTTPSVVSQHQPGSHAVADTADLRLSGITHNMQNQQLESISQHPSNLNAKLIPSESALYYTPRYGGPPKQMPPPVPSLNSSSTHGNLPVSHPAFHSGNNFQPMVTAPMPPNKAYHLQPPPPTVSNQFSYVQSEPQQRAQPWGNCPSFTERFQYIHDIHRGNFYGDRGARGPVQQEIVERGRFSPAFHSGPSVSDKMEASPASLSHYGPPSEPPPIPCPGWRPHPRMSSYSVSASIPSIESPVSRVAGAPGYWRPR